MPEYSIGAARRQDLVAVARLIDRSPELSPNDLTERQVETWARMMRTDDLTVYLAWQGEDAVGKTALLVLPHITYACRPTAFIESMYVRPEHRRRGVARMMVERLLDDAARAGCHKIQLLTHKRHAYDGAHAFYRSLGFEAEAEGFRSTLTRVRSSGRDTDRACARHKRTQRAVRSCGRLFQPQLGDVSHINVAAAVVDRHLSMLLGMSSGL